MIRTLHIKIDPKSIKVDKRLDVIGHEIEKNPAPKPQFGQWIDVPKGEKKKTYSKGPWYFVIKSFNFTVDLEPQPGQKLQENDIGKSISRIEFQYERKEGADGEFVATLYKLDKPQYVANLRFMARDKGELRGNYPDDRYEWDLRVSPIYFKSAYSRIGIAASYGSMSKDQLELVKKLMDTATSMVKQAIKRNQSQKYLKTSQILDEKLFFVFDTSPEGSVPILQTTASSLTMKRWLEQRNKHGGADIEKIRQRVKDNRELIFTGIKDREIQELIIIAHATALCALEKNAGDHFSGKVFVTRPIVVNLSNRKNSSNLASAWSNRVAGAPKGFYEAALPTIQINYPLFKNDPEAKKELLNTYLHEFSHLIVAEAYGLGMTKAHGREFKEVMVVMGEAPRTHGIARKEELQAARKRYQEAVGKKGSEFEPATVEYMEEVARNRPKRKMPPKKVEPEILVGFNDGEPGGKIESDEDDVDFTQFDEG